MANLCNIDGRTLIKYIEYLGFSFVRQNGSHMRYKNEKGHAITLHVKGKKVMKPGRLKGLLKEVHQTSEELYKYLMENK